MSRIEYKAEKLDKAFERLEKLYARIPETFGCLEYIKKDRKDGGCGGVCCSIQCPQLLYCEFLRTLNEILDKWSAEKLLDIIEKAIKTYLYNLPTKGCILWNKDTKLCKCHNSRPLACFMYSIESDEEFVPKMERLIESYKDEPLAIFMKQCRKCKTKDGKLISKEEHDILWKELVEIEKSIGIEENKINDDVDGTYRTFHDHLLIFLLPNYMFKNLSEVRRFGNQEEKEKVVSTFMNVLSPVAKKLTNN